MRTLLLLLVAAAAFAADLRTQLHATVPTWFGYTVKAVREQGSNNCGVRLEDDRMTSTGSGSDSTVAILLRVQNNNVQKVRVYSVSCSLDSGAVPLIWLTGVSAGESLVYLKTLVNSQTPEQNLDGAILAISLHDDPQADTLLAQFAQDSASERVREKAIFWIGASRGSSGVPVLTKILSNESSDNLRDKAVFALSIDKSPEALPALIRAAKSDASPHVRGQALFWLAQKAGQQASSEIVNAIENDPDTEVKKKAVFALSQLPKDEGVPKLIQVAQNQRNPEVRKQAFFWLGQSGDPRALSFIERVVLK